LPTTDIRYLTEEAVLHIPGCDLTHFAEDSVKKTYDKTILIYVKSRALLFFTYFFFEILNKEYLAWLIDGDCEACVQ